MPGGRGDALLVVERCVRGVSCVVARHGLECLVWCGAGAEWLRVVVGSQARSERATRCGRGTESFVVERRGAGACFGNRRCGSQCRVTLRPCRRDARGTLETGCGDRVTAQRKTLETGCVESSAHDRLRTLETGCVEARADTGACGSVTISSGSAGVGA
jgi:hypothetical protein